MALLFNFKGGALNNLLINASSAKSGGAKSIVEKFLSDFDFEGYDNVYVVAPPNLIVGNDKIVHIRFETSGLWSFLYAVFFVNYHLVRFNCKSVFSFGNVNSFFSRRKVTYFHNLNILRKNKVRHYLNRLAIRFFLKRSEIVVQSRYVEREFIKVLGSDYSLSVCWPGCKFYGPSPYSDGPRRRCAVPIMDVLSTHKNFQFILEVANLLDEKGVDILVTADEGPPCKGISYIGKQNDEGMAKLYRTCDLLIFPSIFETVGLPIFEFMSTGKPVLVMESEYIEDIFNQFHRPENLFVFNRGTFDEQLEHVLRFIEDARCVMMNENNQLIKADWSGFDKT